MSAPICFCRGDVAASIHAGEIPQACAGVNLSKDHIHVSGETAEKLVQQGRAVMKDGRLLQALETA